MPMLTPRAKAFWREFLRGRGAGPIVEFALVVPMLLVIMMGVINFGRFYFVKNSLVSAVREGARFAAVQEKPCEKQDDIRLKVINAFAAMGGASIAPAKIKFPACDGLILIGNDVIVKVEEYPVSFVLGAGTTINLQAQAKFRWELSS
ncbi:MAG: TadE/TadG family type IV pilus assembly protein [Gemmatimonadota bacterium]|jgi:hypothetical protein|nr:TadE/TadG family type IV pilus assembly protein [Gemmatimonadota bacterium]MDQ8167891.1 TadE/TadG family type IV pilus assembly protein [Gemmatimonadota bacterium]MDQ8173777.1 TadE/TadG family type IV pilus assembly protein [Gemmatimonadota bacterium]